MSETAVKTSSRIAILDELRGLCVLLMVLYHGLYTLGYHLGWEVCRTLFRFFTPVEPLFAGIFIALCGLCCTLSHNNWKRGGILAVVAAGVSAVMAIGFPEDAIWFGVLHLLATCILLYALGRPLWEKIPGPVGLPVCALLLVLCWNLPVQQRPGFFGIEGLFEWPVPPEVTRQVWLFPLGLGRIAGTQGDYFPLLPWIFCFFGGSFLGRYLHRLPQVLRRPHLPPLSFLGRHALVIYVVHQPVIFGLGSLLTMMID